MKDNGFRNETGLGSSSNFNLFSIWVVLRKPLRLQLGRSPREGNGNLLQYSCLENSTEKGTGGLQSMGSQRVGHLLLEHTHKLL